MQQVVFGLLVCSVLAGVLNAQESCEHIFATNLNEEDKITLCRLYRSSAVLSQLSVSITNVMDQFINKHLGNDADEVGILKPKFEKRKHEYLRFGRR